MNKKEKNCVACNRFGCAGDQCNCSCHAQPKLDRPTPRQDEPSESLEENQYLDRFISQLIDYDKGLLSHGNLVVFQRNERRNLLAAEKKNHHNFSNSPKCEICVKSAVELANKDQKEIMIRVDEREKVIREVEENVHQHIKKMFEVSKGILPFTMLDAKADENERRRWFLCGVEEVLKVVARLKETKE